MEKRITLVTMFDNEEINKIETLMLKTNKKTCKVPYGIDDEKRYEIDNLPYHFTISATNKENQEEILKIAESINIDKIQLKVNDIKIMNVKHNSYCLYLAIEENQQIKELQRIFYNKFPQEKYNPDDIFKNKKQTISTDENISNTVAMVEYKESIFKKIINKIKRLFIR